MGSLFRGRVRGNAFLLMPPFRAAGLGLIPSRPRYSFIVSDCSLADRERELGLDPRETG